MRRARRYSTAVWAHLLWRRGQTAPAAMLVGAFDARTARIGGSRWVNGHRLVAEARAGLSAELEADAFADALGAGAVLGEAEIVALVTEALARPGSARK
jgi:hypothetical protein